MSSRDPVIFAGSLCYSVFKSVGVMWGDSLVTSSNVAASRMRVRRAEALKLPQELSFEFFIFCSSRPFKDLFSPSQTKSEVPSCMTIDRLDSFPNTSALLRGQCETTRGHSTKPSKLS